MSSSAEENSAESSEEDIRPTFVRKSDRVTLGQSQSRTNEDVAAEELKKVQRKRALVLETAREAEESKQLDANGSDSEAGLPEDESDDEIEEFQAWKIRELNRIHRDLQERQQIENERQELLKRRNLTDEEIMKEKQFDVRHIDRENKAKWKFLQKYYHKGAFYMDTSSVKTGADVRAKDYSAPTAEDKIDKERLPQIMQVKNFGKKGRTKYTHLVDQDTTMQKNKRIDYRLDNRIVSSFYAKRQKI